MKHDAHQQNPSSAPSLFKEALISRLPIKGTLSLGEPYEITISRSSAVADGVHLIFSMNSTLANSISSKTQGEAIGVLINVLEEFELANKFGYRISVNSGPLLTRPHFHIHGIIPGSDTDVADAPRLVEPWKKPKGLAS